MVTEHRWQRDALAGVGGVAAVTAIIVVLRAVQDDPNPTIAALLFLLVVLVAATIAQVRVAIALAVAATLAFNFFLLPPFHTLSIAEPQNWVALFVFVVVAFIASQLSAAVRQRADEAEVRLHLLAERKKAEMLTQRADLASALLASISHDLRTPVTSVRMAVTNLQDLTLPQEERRAQAQLALQELDRLTRLFQDILDMARIDAAAVNPERQWVSPAELVDAAVTHVAPALARHTLDVDADGLSEIQADPRLTSNALAHVLENAARYSPEGTSISIRAWTKDDGSYFTVRDHGPGLAASDMDRLFEPFYRSQKTRHATGTGLGLAITRGLLAADGGRIWCENVPDGGAQFTIVVPATVRVPHAQPS